MTSYRVIEATQKDVLRYFLVGASNSLEQETFLVPDGIPELVTAGACLILWNREFPLIPYALVAEPEVLRRVLPKLMALPSLAAPVTSLFRAWDIDDVHAFNRRRPLGLGQGRLEAFVGLMVGELTSRIGPQLDLKALSSSSLRRTLAYALTTLHLAGAADREVDVAIRNWGHVAELTQNQIDPALIGVLARLSSFVQELPPTPRFNEYQLGNSLRDWAYRRDGGDPIFGHVLGQAISELGALKDVSREKRFDALMSLTQTVQRSGADGTGSAQIVAGYLLSLIEPGSLDFLPLSYEMEEALGGPGIACSYAMCAALMSGKEFLMRGSGLGIHIALSGLQQSRMPDISYQELQILARSAAIGDLSLRTSVPSLLEVELLPEITAAFFVGQRKSDQVDSRPHGAQLDVHQVAEIERIAIGLEELGHIAGRLRATLLRDDTSASTLSKGRRLYKRK